MFAVLVPLKRPDRAKTRLAQSGVVEHQRLAVAFAWDAIAAALASPLVAGVWVVTEAIDLVPEQALRLPDEGEGDLNRALTRAADTLSVVQPTLGIAALCADLPSLATEDLTEALQRCTRRSFVADADGTGTTMLITPAGTALRPSFGIDSANAHTASGAHPLTDALTTLRMDVDTAADLERAVQFGVGPNTKRVLETL